MWIICLDSDSFDNFFYFVQILFQKDEDLLNSRESIVMITKDNEKYRCILPQKESKQEVSCYFFFYFVILSGYFIILT